MEEKFLDLAFKEAEKAYVRGEVPVGAVIVKDGKVIASAYNMKEKRRCATEHAEIITIRKATKKLKNWRLEDCEMYVTLEPCPMCASAIKQSRIKSVYAGISNKDRYNNHIIKQIFGKDNTNASVKFINALAVDRSEKLLQKFFCLRRKK